MTHKILTGDALAMLRTLPDQSIHCCVTSPPYWGLRDYGTGDAQIGLEDTPEAYVGRMVAVFEEVRRVLRDDGTLWLNLGDIYARYHGNKNSEIPTSATNGWTNGTNENLRGSALSSGLKPKDLVGIPWRVAFALQSAGWWLRSDIIWAKPNPMPESVTDRPAKAHEYVFLLAKSERYYYDADAIREKSVTSDFRKPYGVGQVDNRGNGHDRNGGALRTTDADPTTRNRRSVWTIATRPYPEAHFAVYPPALVEPCILAGTSAHGVCPACGAPWVRVVDREFVPQSDVSDPAKLQKKSNKGMDQSNGWGDTPRGTVATTTTGWEPSCTCDAGDPIPATVLDPFAGSGTTLAVAIEHKRAAVGIELNPDYVRLIDKRLAGVQPRLLNL